MSNREIRRKLEEGGDAAQAKDLLRQSFARHSTERREQAERTEQRRAERARRLWQEVANNEKEGE
jgi:hypothetical protein